MTNARQIKRLFTPLLARNHDLALVKSQLVAITPLRHVLCGILIDRTSDATRFKPRWLVLNLFTVRQHVGLNLGDLIYRRPINRWLIEEDGVGEDLARVIEEEVLPKLRAVRTLQDFVATAEQSGSFSAPRGWPTLVMLVKIACGDLDGARADLDRCRDEWHWFKTSPSYDRYRHLETLFMADDRAGLVALLHDWEAQTVENLKLGRFWERTPFPLEELAALAG